MLEKSPTWAAHNQATLKPDQIIKGKIE